MALLDVVIQVLNINCSVVQCSGYSSDIEALFYVLFFPTVFIILFVYIVTGAIISRMDGKPGALRILISVALYAFIIFEGFYSLFASLSRVWWLLLVTLVGLWIFIRQFIHGGGGGGGGGAYSGVGGSWLKPRAIEKAKKEWFGALDPADITTLKGYCSGIESQFVKLASAVAQVSDTSGEGRKGALEIYEKTDKTTQEAIQALDDFLDQKDQYKKVKHPGLNENFRSLVKSYWKRLEDMRKEMGKVKK